MQYVTQLIYKKKNFFNFVDFFHNANLNSLKYEDFRMLS
jgi:hypothetical protein